MISPGNTGALVAGSLKLRPARRRGPAGHCHAHSLAHAAISSCWMPAPTPVANRCTWRSSPSWAASTPGKFSAANNPRVGILSNGTEDTKGNELTREAARLCTQLDLNFIGNVEGFDLFNDDVDVVVCDGSSATSSEDVREPRLRDDAPAQERTDGQSRAQARRAAVAQDAFRSIKRRMDPEVYGGAALLGFNGTVIKAHGSARERAIMNAIRVTTEEISHRVNQIISQRNRARQRTPGRRRNRRFPVRPRMSPSIRPQVQEPPRPATTSRAAPAPSPASAPTCPPKS